MTRRQRLRRGCLGLTAAVIVAVLALLAWKAITWPDVASLKTHNPTTTAFIQRWQERQERAGKPREVELRWAPYDHISPHLKRAVLVSEDIDFFSHNGFATDEIRNALREAAEGRGLRGASTLSQQLAKNLWLAPSRTPWRKLEEALLTIQLEHDLDKRRLLELYLNVVEFGPGVWGVGNASRHFFGSPPAELTEEQAAELAASLPRPATWHPGVSTAGYQRRVESIRRRMDRAQWLWKVID